MGNHAGLIHPRRNSLSDLRMPWKKDCFVTDLSDIVKEVLCDQTVIYNNCAYLCLLVQTDFLFQHCQFHCLQYLLNMRRRRKQRNGRENRTPEIQNIECSQPTILMGPQLTDKNNRWLNWSIHSKWTEANWSLLFIYIVCLDSLIPSLKMGPILNICFHFTANFEVQISMFVTGHCCLLAKGKKHRKNIN